MFLDEHGRRRPWVALGGTLTAAAAAMWLGGLVAGAVGFTNLPAWRALPAGAPTPGAPYVAGARADRPHHSARLDRNVRVLVRGGTGTPRSPGAHPVLLAATKLS